MSVCTVIDSAGLSPIKVKNLVSGSNKNVYNIKACNPGWLVGIDQFTLASSVNEPKYILDSYDFLWPCGVTVRTNCYTYAIIQNQPPTFNFKIGNMVNASGYCISDEYNKWTNFSVGILKDIIANEIVFKFDVKPILQSKNNQSSISVYNDIPFCKSCGTINEYAPKDKLITSCYNCK